MSAIAKRMALVGCGLLVAALAMAQALPPAVTQGQLTPAGTGAVTTGPLTLVVDPANGGNDSNTCTGYGAGACGGMQAAEQKIPKNIRHAVKVVVDGGSYACSTWEGFTFSSDADAGVYGTLWVDAIEAPAQVAGLDSGTVASATDFVIAATNVAPTVTVAGAGWTVNALQGLHFHFDTGTGAGQELEIVSNTATVLTLSGGYQASTAAWVQPSIYNDMTQAFAGYVAPDGTTHFSILKNAASITGACFVPLGPNTKYAANLAYGIQITGMRGGAAASSFAGGNFHPQLTDAQAPVLFTHFDLNTSDNADPTTGVMITNSDSVQFRGMSCTAESDSCFSWNNVRRLSLFSNSDVVGPMLLHPDGYAGDTLLLFGNVVGKADNSSGSLAYLNYRALLWPRQIWNGLNAYRFGGNILSQTGFPLSGGGIQSYYDYGNFYSGYNTDGIDLGAGVTAQVQASTFVGKTGADSAITIAPGSIYQGKQNVGSTGQKYGYRLQNNGPIISFSPAIGATNDTLTGTVGDICLDPACADVMSTTNYVASAFIRAESTNAVHDGVYENRYKGNAAEGIRNRGDAGVDGNLRVGGTINGINIGNDNETTGYTPLGQCFGTCAKSVDFVPVFTMNKPGDGKVGTCHCQVGTVGTGGTTGVVLAVKNKTASANIGTCTLGACNTAINTDMTCNINALLATTAANYSYQLDSTTDCTLDPANVTCSCEIQQ